MRKVVQIFNPQKATLMSLSLSLSLSLSNLIENKKKGLNQIQKTKNPNINKANFNKCTRYGEGKCMMLH